MRPVALGAVVAWSAVGSFHLAYFVLTLLGVIFDHVARPSSRGATRRLRWSASTGGVF
jgi:hypothetical protein